jgi:hypothetical protein
VESAEQEAAQVSCFSGDLPKRSEQPMMPPEHSSLVIDSTSTTAAAEWICAIAAAVFLFS